MDRTGRVDGVYRRLKIARQAEQIRAEPPPLPGKGPYRAIVVDPPWRDDVRDEAPQGGACGHTVRCPFLQYANYPSCR